jgi:hypothetical protein
MPYAPDRSNRKKKKKKKKKNIVHDIWYMNSAVHGFVYSGL